MLGASELIVLLVGLIAVAGAAAATWVPLIVEWRAGRRVWPWLVMLPLTVFNIVIWGIWRLISRRRQHRREIAGPTLAPPEPSDGQFSFAYPDPMAHVVRRARRQRGELFGGLLDVPVWRDWVAWLAMFAVVAVVGPIITDYRDLPSRDSTDHIALAIDLGVAFVVQLSLFGLVPASIRRAFRRRRGHVQPNDIHPQPHATGGAAFGPVWTAPEPTPPGDPARRRTPRVVLVALGSLVAMFAVAVGVATWASDDSEERPDPCAGVYAQIGGLKSDVEQASAETKVLPYYSQEARDAKDRVRYATRVWANLILTEPDCFSARARAEAESTLQLLDR